MVNQEAVPSNNMRRARRGNAVGATICARLLFSVKRGLMSLGDMIAISPAETHQNLSLFGKFFIDIKTLFFDCENCELFDPITLCPS